jgi:hypothetical protein
LAPKGELRPDAAKLLNANGRKPAHREGCDHSCKKGADFGQHLHVNPDGSNAPELTTGGSGMMIFVAIVKKPHEGSDYASNETDSVR